jgi:predicted O-methyltransferase YrrM
MIHPKLSEAYKTRKIATIDKELVEFHSGINEGEAEMLSKIIRDIKASTTLEIGLAMGASAITFCNAASANDSRSIHYAIDPNQYSDYNGIGVNLINEAGYNRNFKLIEGKTHEVFHFFLANNIKLDMAFIDGWHTFDYTFIDFFFIDKILKDGGILAFHDMYGMSKQKVLGFIKTHRDYEILYQYKIRDKSRLKTLKMFVWRIFKKPLLIFSWYHWKFQLSSSNGIIFLKKKSSFEPNFDFYKPF